MLDELVAGKEAITRAGLNLAVITQGTPETAAEFAKVYAPGLLVLADPEREAYAAYGLEKGTIFQTYLNPKVWDGIPAGRQKRLRSGTSTGGSGCHADVWHFHHRHKRPD